VRWTDFLHPERVFALAAKLFLGLLALIIVASLMLSALAQAQFSPADALGMLAGLAILSIIAYVIREHRKRARPRPRNTRGAERTPLLPQTEEDE
jgi:cyanate permease